MQYTHFTHTVLLFVSVGNKKVHLKAFNFFIHIPLLIVDDELTRREEATRSELCRFTYQALHFLSHTTFILYKKCIDSIERVTLIIINVRAT